MAQRKSSIYHTRAIPLDRYAGEWVVLARDAVIGHSKSLPDAIHKAAQRGVKQKPAVFLVPRKDEGPFLLFL